MRKIITLMMLLIPCAALATADCQIIDYPDHVEALCEGVHMLTPASPQNTELEQTVASTQTDEQEVPDFPPPEKIVLNDLVRLHAAATWLKK
jgi:hypothetical protein